MLVLSAGMRSSPGKPGADLVGQQRHSTPGEIIPEWRRDHFGTVGEIISEWWATSFRNRGRLHSEIRTPTFLARIDRLKDDPRAVIIRHHYIFVTTLEY